MDEGPRKTLISSLAKAAQHSATSRTLRFTVCNGFANQRLAILYGIVLALRTGRIPILPDLIHDGIQLTDAHIMPTADNTQPFSEFYDVAHFTASLLTAGIPILLPSKTPPTSSYTAVSMKVLGQDPVKALTSSRYSSLPHIALDCPLFKMQLSDFSPEDDQTLWAVLLAFTPSTANQMLVAQARHAMSLVQVAHQSSSAAVAISSRKLSDRDSSIRKYNVLHLRLEDDWQEHCKRWGNSKIAGRENCLTNTEDIYNMLQLFNFPRDLPLYVGSYWKGADPKLVAHILGNIRTAGYTIVRLDDVLPSAAALPREKLALLEYNIAMGADR